MKLECSSGKSVKNEYSMWLLGISVGNDFFCVRSVTVTCVNLATSPSITSVVRNLIPIFFAKINVGLDNHREIWLPKISQIIKFQPVSSKVVEERGKNDGYEF